MRGYEYLGGLSVPFGTDDDGSCPIEPTKPSAIQRLQGG